MNKRKFDDLHEALDALLYTNASNQILLYSIMGALHVFDPAITRMILKVMAEESFESIPGSEDILQPRKRELLKALRAKFPDSS